MEEFFGISQKLNIFSVIAIVSLILLIISTAIDRRRFRNAIYLQVFVLTGLVALLGLLYDNPFYPLVYFLIVVLASFLVFIVPFLLIINGFVVVKREGFSLSNIVALLFGILILVGEVAAAYSLSSAGPLYTNYMLVGLLLFGMLVFYISMVFLAFMFYSFFIRLIPRRLKFDYVVVLGAGLINGERVTKLLSERIDKAIKVYKRSGGKCRLIMSGGQGADEKISEAQAMKNYALNQGVPEDAVLLEDKSINTMQNLVNSQKLIEEQPGHHTTAVVTSQYHVLRANVYAKALQFPMTGIGAHTAFYYWPAAMTREYAGLVKHYWKTYLIFYLLFAVPLIATLFL